MGENPLGRPTDFPHSYDPAVLHAVSRSESRATLGIGAELPFHGEDIWNAWELAWLDDHGKPAVATATLRVPAESPHIIESKSLKLYLNSLAESRFPSALELAATLRSDLSAVAGCDIAVDIHDNVADGHVATLPGQCLDDLEVKAELATVDATVLASSGDPVGVELHSHLLRSLCPVTNQPDSGSILVRYFGPQIDPAALLRYLISYRRHNDFHEACVERIFMDLKVHCAPQQLTVHARYNRRGGIDINPFRSDFEACSGNLRLWRQ